MKQKYLFENTDNNKIILNLDTNSYSSVAKKKQSKILSVITFLSLLMMFFFGNTMNGQTTVTTTGTGSGTWTVPCDVSSISVQVWGPGGKGGNVSGKSTYGGGGGSGAYSTSTLSVTPGQVISFVVGAGNSTSNTTFLTLTAGYGTSGGSNTGGAGTGGSASGGTTNSSGGSGTAGIMTLSGAGGNSPSGGTGGAGRTTDNDGNNGNYPGGGGGGAINGNGSNSYNGGNGGNGQIKISYTSLLSYCTPSFTNATVPITNVTFAGINNNSASSIGGLDYESFCLTGSVIQGSATNAISVKGNTNGNYTNYIRVYIDWDHNGVFGNTANEIYDLGTIINSTGIDAAALTGNIVVPATAIIGVTRMRTMKNLNTYPTGPCQTGTGYGQAEDYSVNVVAPSSCITPLSQPTALSLTANGNTITGSFTRASPAADNYLILINTTGVAPTPANGTTYAIGDTVGSGNIVADIDNNNTFSATGLSQLQKYYIFVFSYNSLCSGGPIYNISAPLAGNTTTLTATYCTPTGNLNCTANDLISNVTINTLNNTSTCGTGGYTNYAATGTQTTSLTKGTSYNFSLKVGTGSGTHGAGVWIDFNQNGVFTDAGEYFLVSNTIAANSTTTISIPIPLGAAAGTTRMRVRYAYATAITSASGLSCTMLGTYGETEDYTISIINASVCATPTAQPTVLILTPTGNSIGGSFTYANPIANNYLVTISTVNTAPTPVNATTYNIGDVIGSSKVVDIDNNNTFLAIGLTPSTTYYIHVFSYNSLCTGGPLYYTTTPLNGTSATLVASSYCVPSVSTSTWANYDYISNVSFVGTLNDTSNNSTYSTSPLGFQDYTGLASKPIQAQGEGVNIFVQAKNTSYMKAWVDWNRDGTYADPGEIVYNTGGIATYSTTFGFAIPNSAVLGDYRVRIRINSRDTKNPVDSNSTPTFGPCANINYGGETEDYLFTVVASCSALVTSVTDGINCGPGKVNLSVTGSAGTTSYRWYTSETGGTPVNTATNSWTTPLLTATTTYYVTANNGTCESLVRTPIVANINPIPTLTFTPSNPIVCGENGVIALTASGDKQQTYLINESFENGTLGDFINLNYVTNGVATDPLTSWQIRTSTFIPAQQVWFPAISSGFGSNRFVMATSDVGPYVTHNGLVSKSVNSTGYLDLTLTFKAFYSRYYIDDTATTLDYVTVDVSTDAGTSWTEISRWTSDLGIGTRFGNLSFNLNAYINQPSLKIRIRYYGEWVDGIAIDDVKLFGFIPLSTAFSWSSTTPVDAYSDAACTVPYSTAVPTVYIKPTTTQLESSSYSFTATATLSNGCAASQPITVQNTTKFWKGTTDNDWNKASNWLPAAVPTSSTCVIVPAGTASKIMNTPDAFAKTVTVKAPAGNLELQSGKNLTVTDNIIVEPGATFNIRDKASLIQTNNIANTGIVNIERITPPISKLDFTYWGSPVTLASNFTLGSLSSSSPLMFSWVPTIANGAGNWQNETTATIMDPRKGYIVRAPNTFSSSTKTSYTATFTGTPNNGNIAASISKGSLIGTVDVDAENDEWNLIANPYPSALDAAAFLNLAGNVPVIEGTLYLWTHNSQPSTIPPDPFYGDFVLNYTDADYAVFNTTGGTATAPAFIGGSTPTGYIASGQSFFVKAANSMANGTTANATFNNSMRVGVAGKNGDFFKLTKNNKDEAIPKSVTDIERHRIWINLTNNSGAFSQTLVGYVQDATQGLDRSFDGESLGGNDVSFYSIVPEAELTIQGRALPFDENDLVPLGYNSEITGELSIRIDHIDGLFNTQNIYLEDKELSVIHNLKEKPYVFNTEKGDFNDRFVLRYSDKTLGTNTFNLSNSDLVNVIVNQDVTVKSYSQLIKNITVYDLLGRKVDSYQKVNALKYTLNHLNKTTTGLIVKITLDDDTLVSQKIIY